ncbi:hypothetical protein C8J57DRAFT_1214164 [Mycena rebaudengoi]|nr:hypothetical protein C8J57DRAFT_1214164 [Mycena rebaudengoi]
MDRNIQVAGIESGIIFVPSMGDAQVSAASPTHSEFQCSKLHTHQNSTAPYAAHRTPAIFMYFGVPQTTPFERATSAPHSGAPLQFHDNSTPRKPRHFYVWVAS